MSWTEVLSLVFWVGAFVAIAVWRLPATFESLGLRWRELGRGLRGPPSWVQTTAKVADVSAVDVGEGEHARTMYRIVLLFTQENGEAIAVDRTCRLVQYEKDILLPDAIVPIRYDPRDPERFEIEFGRIPRAGEPPLAGPAAPRAGERAVYSPPK